MSARGGDGPVHEATRIQREAAGPNVSVALRASAGSGKTKVLIDRFVRLCVEGEHNDTHPRSVLAITFTRKAATEIRERLTRRARHLALASSAARRETLTDLFGRPPLAAETDRAARLHERLLENLSGLQVGTLHAFCQRILVRFAAEAGLDPRARLIEDREELLDEVLDRVQTVAAADPELTEQARILAATPEGVRKALRTFFGEEMRLERWLRRTADHEGRPHESRLVMLPSLLAELRAWLFTDAAPSNGRDLAEPDLAAAAAGVRRALQVFADEGLAAVAAELDAAEAKKLARSLEVLRAAAADAIVLFTREGADEIEDALVAARKVLLRQDGRLRSLTRIRDAELKERFHALVLAQGADLLTGLRRMALIQLYVRNRAWFELGLRALDTYDALKKRDGVVDFGDLEDMACRLMGDQARALSLLFRLDDSIRHILLDEFQDTNWNQLEILEPFIEEFLAGGRDTSRTVFAVGDLKQSIYGFRGAEPGIFAALRRELARRDQPTPTLPTNFRSLPAIVAAVGRLFAADPLVRSLPEGEAAYVHQSAARAEEQGTVVMPAPFAAAADGRSGRQVAADAAARLVRELVTSEPLDRAGHGDAPAGRPLAWGDVLVLMRTRTDASLYEQAFRRAGVPIEPAGRGMLAATREVQDVQALLRWLVWPEDDVALATVLRSPLVRLSEEEFQHLLGTRGLLKKRDDGRYRKPQGLWSALQKAGQADEHFGEIGARLTGWRSALGFGDVHELLRRIQREGRVRERYSAAMGPQAALNLARLFDLALSADVVRAPTVRRFVEVLDRLDRRGGEDEGAPTPGAGGGRVRLMTVHGAKGLEAPVVVLVDADRPVRDRDNEVKLNPGDRSTGVIFGVTREHRDGAVGAEDVLPPDLLQAGCAAARTAMATEESNLLYVALTRARDRLYVLGGEVRGTSFAGAADEGEYAGTPLRQLRAAAAADADGPVELADPEGWERPPDPVAAVDVVAGAAAEDVRVWTPPPLGPRYRVETPSAVDGFDGPSGRDRDRAAALTHGERVHRWLQLACDEGVMPPGHGDDHAEAAAVFGAPELAWIFSPEERGLSEAPFICRRSRAGGGSEVRLTGFIDRLVWRPGRLDIIDYKSNRGAADPDQRARMADHYRPQLEAYGEAMTALYPDRAIGLWLLFTDPAVAPDRRLLRLDDNG